MLARALKTHANSNKYAEFCLKPTHFATNYAKSSPHAGGGLLAIRASSVEEACLHALTQLRTHARTTRTRNETETDFPIGVSKNFFPPNLRCMFLPSLRC